MTTDEVDLAEYRERARVLLAEHKVTFRSCWECNSAHEHLKEGEDVVLLCFGCGNYYLGAVKL